jgi:hypothetical protein
VHRGSLRAPVPLRWEIFSNPYSELSWNTFPKLASPFCYSEQAASSAIRPRFFAEYWGELGTEQADVVK